MNREVYASSESGEWATPQWLYDWCNEVWGPFTLDVAATPENAKCEEYLTREMDGLLVPWGNDLSNVWVNPPYGKGIEDWVRKAAVRAQRGHTTLMLLPARTDTWWFHRFVFGGAAELVFLRGRIPFEGDKDNHAPFPSCLAWYTQRGRFVTLPAISTFDLQDIAKERVRVPPVLAGQTSIYEVEGLQ